MRRKEIYNKIRTTNHNATSEFMTGYLDEEIDN